MEEAVTGSRRYPLGVMNGSRTVIGYTRVSKEEQATEGLSIEVQEEKIRAYCDDKGYQLEEAYSDPGVTGRTLDRPGLTDLRERLAKGRLYAVVIRNVDRLSRDVRHLKELVDEIHDANARLLSTDDRIGGQVGLDSREAPVFLDLTAMFAEWDWLRTSESTKEGQAARRARGEVDTGSRYGFVKSDVLEAPIPGTTKTRRYRVWVENPAEIAVLKIIWARHHQGASANRIAQELNAAGHPAKRGGLWTREVVRQQIKHLEKPELEHLYASVINSGEGE